MSNKNIPLILITFLYFSLVTKGQTLDDNQIKANLKQHISYLASDKLEGRETGKKGELLAEKYIIEQFTKISLTPMGTDKYVQEFPFTEGVKFGKSCELTDEHKTHKLNTDWYPLSYSCAKGTVKGTLVNVKYGIVTPKLDYDDYKGKKDLKGKIFMINISSPDGMSPHSKYNDYSDLRTRIDTAIARGAAAIIFINLDTTVDNPKNDFTNKITPSSIPVVFANAGDELCTFDNAHYTLTVDITRLTHTGHNIIGFIDNGAKTTVVIGAHYDHLGYGGEGSGSLYRGKPAIHHGADDNASGTAAVIELARYYKTSNDKNNNYLFCAFSGEEKGLLGSNYFVKNPTYPLANMNYMINMDMVGRLKPDEKSLSINGVGSSPIWHSLVDTIQRDGIKVKTTESGIGPSDYTSFYLKDIPVIFFFTGSHNDYHKPSDTEDKINYPGELSVMKIIIAMVDALNTKGKLEFTKTKDEDSKEAPRFKVTMGVIPDYAFDGEGMRIDGVSDGKPASKAGLKSGDILIQMDDFKVTDMMSYMKALGMHKKGDTVTLKVKRGNEMKEIKLTF